MCNNLVERGNLDQPLIIFNRTRKRAEDLHAKLPRGKSVVAGTIDEAVAKSDIIFWCLGDDAAVRGTVAIMIKGDVKGKLFVDCSTIHPDTTNMIARDIEAQSAQFVGLSRCVLQHSVSAMFLLKPFTQYLVHPPWPSMFLLTTLIVLSAYQYLSPRGSVLAKHVIGPKTYRRVQALTRISSTELASLSVSLPVQRQRSTR